MSGNHCQKIMRDDNKNTIGGWKWFPAIWTVIPIGIFIYYCLAYLNRIGISYDETVFVNAALGGITYDLVYKKVFNIPVMVLPYIGIIKPIIYYPIFKLFGVGIYSIRLPVIFISAVTLAIWYRNIGLLARNTVLAVAFLFIIATDPIFIIQSKLDIGPTVVQDFLLAASVCLFLPLLTNKSVLQLSLLFMTLIVGAYNKANFIWFISSCIAACAIFFPREIICVYRNNPRASLAVTVAFLILLCVIIACMVIPSAFNYPIGNLLHVSPQEKVSYMYHLLAATLNGSVMFYYFFSSDVSAASFANVIELTAFAVWLLFALSLKVLGRRNQEFGQYSRYICFFFLIFLLELLQIVITPQGRLPAHIMILWPLNHLIFILTLYSFYSLFPSAIIGRLLLLPPVLLVVSQLYVNDIYLLQFKNPAAYKNQLWSPAVYDLSKYINEHIKEYDYVLSLDFGLNNQVFALASDNVARTKFHDIWYFFSDNPDIIRARNFFYPMFNHDDQTNWQWLYDKYFNRKKTLVIGFSGKEWIIGATEKFYRFADKYNLKVDFVTSIHDAMNNDIYNLYSVTNQAAN